MFEEIKDKSLTSSVINLEALSSILESIGPIG